MVMYKIRQTGSNKGIPSHAITVPREILMFHKETYFTVEKSGASIIFTSGANQLITNEILEEYNYEDCDIL